MTVGSPLPQLGDLSPYCISSPSRVSLRHFWSDTGSPFTAIGASREAMLGVLVEPTSLLGCGRRTGCRFHQHQQHHRHRLSLATEPEHPAGAGALCLCVRHFYRNGKSPFDLAEAEQELQEGRPSQYSGSGFGVKTAHQPTAGGVGPFVGCLFRGNK
ncbi:NADH-quinone oxidoreductase subunit H [Shigella flexneri]